MSTGWAGFIADHHEDESPAERSVRLARQADQRDDRQAEKTEAERAAAVAERRELLELAALQAGMTARSTADVFADAAHQGDEDTAYNEALKVIERIDKRRANRQRDMVLQAERMAGVTGLASRSASTITGGEDMLAGAKQALAGHREYVQATRAKMRDAAAGTPRQPRPFVSRSRGAGQAVRSEHCTHCIEQGVDDETAFLLHSDPQHPLPVTPPQQPVQAERRVPMIYSGAEIAR